ncbi:MAG: UDP-3-O-acyl-N-acetylglucosamine deacetylase [Desulfobacteraceae bacterium]|nr:UDP-3-O-acyl-N-acetylglucosamine deacetylase [Desulfobacteraceae bacterium]
MQKTLAQEVVCLGIGVHSGKETTITVKPAQANHGIAFRRTDLPGMYDIQALFKRVVDTSLATVLGANGAIVSTIEHLMAAFAGLGIDNALVEINDYEVPVMDGSAKEFVSSFIKAGIEEQQAPKQFFVVKEPIKLSDGDKYVVVYPEKSRRITCFVDFDHPLIGEQEFVFDPDTDNFGEEISGARTFGFMKDIEYLKKFGLGKGGSLDNAIIIDKDKILNKEGLRYKDEFVRHKLLDSLGDFSLLGMPIMGHIKTCKSGHALNHLFIRKFLQEKDKWKTCSVKKDQVS